MKKKSPLENLTDEELSKGRREYLLWGMIPATVFILLEIFVTYNPAYKNMEVYILFGLVATFPFIFKAGQYSKEYRRRKGK